MRMRSALRSLGFVVLVVAAGCTDKPTPLDPLPAPPGPDPDTGTVSFEEDIEPLFRRYLCLNCHSTPANSNFSVASYELFLTPGDQASVRGLLPVKPGDPDSSYVLWKLAGRGPQGETIMGSRMPQGGGQMSSADQALLRTWIDEGALDN
jgi:hypothetical protein